MKYTIHKKYATYILEIRSNDDQRYPSEINSKITRLMEKTNGTNDLFSYEKMRRMKSGSRYRWLSIINQSVKICEEYRQSHRNKRHTWGQLYRTHRGCQRQEANPSWDRHYRESLRGQRIGSINTECRDCAMAENLRNCHRRRFCFCQRSGVLSSKCLAL